MNPGPKPDPWGRLAQAAILYSAALEDEKKAPKKEADRLVKAALFYQRTPRPIGRPQKVKP
jgi:hypothetical protein